MTSEAAPIHSDALARGGPIRWLVVGGLLLIGSIAIGAAIIAGNSREHALRGSERELENTVLLLARHFDQQFQDFGAIQRDVSAFVQSAGIDSREGFRRRMSSEDIHAMLKAKVGALSYLGGVTVFDADGTLINASAIWPVPSVNIADRAYFQRLKNDPHAPYLVVEPVHSRLNGAWTTVIARKLTGPGGEFLGVVGRGIKPTSFESFLASVTLGPDIAISMHHRDGTLLARYPHAPEMIGRNFKQGPADQQRVFELPQYTARLVSPIDGQERLVASRGLTSFPIVIVATITKSSALSSWHRQVSILVAVAGASVLAIATLLFLVVRKLSQQYRASERRLTLEKQRLDRAINNMTQGLLMFDASEQLVVRNQRYIDMYALSPEVVKPGTGFRDIIHHRKATGSLVGDDEAYIASVLREVDRRKVSIIEIADGRSVQIINEPLADGGWLATHEDITERRRTEQQIARLAHYDALTDLPNRALFHERLSQQLAGLEPGRRLAVHFIDIDEFKSVNDTLGHQIGDALLRSVADSLGRCVGEHDFVARLSGDEFAIVQSAVGTIEDVAGLATRLRDAIRTPFNCLGHRLTADASIGVALAPDHGTDLDQILRNADLAMYAAKAAGRRTWRLFDPEMESKVRSRRQLEVDLREAIATGGLEVHYQPCLSLRDDRITGCEALVRWRHPARGPVSPAEFIPIAEESGLIDELGEWVLTTACIDAARWPADMRLAVNVSPVQFRSGTLALKIMAALAASGLPAQRLELEITEAVLIRDDEAALAILHQLRAIGVRIALDDFGTGYSSLSYLQRFPFDKIKIDRVFVSDIAASDGSSSIVQAVVQLAAARHMSTTAEGVETEAQKQLLRSLGCSEMQGHLFSAAKPADQLAALFATHLGEPLQQQQGRRRAAL